LIDAKLYFDHLFFNFLADTANDNVREHVRLDIFSTLRLQFLYPEYLYRDSIMTAQSNIVFGTGDVSS